MHITEFGVIGVYFIVIFLAIYGLERLRVPNILGFLALGLISQYLGRYLVPLPLTEAFPLIGELAVWLLFFFIGLEYSPEALARMSRSLWKPGLIDFGVNFFVPLLLLSALAYPFSQALVLSAALYPSSTVIVARLLADTRRLASSEAELLIGVLIFEDVIGILLLTFLGGAGHTERSLYSILALAGSFLMVVGVFMLLSRWGLHLIERLLTPLAGHELAVFLVVGLVLGLGALGHAIGLSGALLTFLLGVLIPEENPFYETASRTLVPFKELAVGLFFFAIPSTMVLTQVPGLSVLGLSLVGIGLKGVSTYVGAWVYGLGPRGRYRAALSFLPKGEFSLLFAQLGQAVSGLIVGIVILSSVVGTILFVQAERLSNYLVPRKPKKGAVGASVARG